MKLSLQNFNISFSDLNKIFSLTLALIIFFGLIFICGEPAISSAVSSDTKTVVVNLSVGEGITLTTNNSSVSMSLMSVYQNTSVGTTTFTVSTNAVAGYKLELNATATPAMASGATEIPDATTTPSLIAAIPDSGTYAFGFSSYGINVPTNTFGTTASGCAEGDVGTPSASLKWRGFAGASKIQIASQSSTTTVAGNVSTVCFFAKQNNSSIPSGTYNATIVATATTL